MKTMTRDEIALMVDAWLNEPAKQKMRRYLSVTPEQIVDDLHRAHTDGIRKHNIALFHMTEEQARRWCTNLGVKPRPYIRSTLDEKKRNYKAEQKARETASTDSVMESLRVFNAIFNSGEKRRLIWR